MTNKVYCSECTYYKLVTKRMVKGFLLKDYCAHKSNIGCKQSAIQPEIYYVRDCNDLNMNNDCPNFKNKSNWQWIKEIIGWM